VRLARAAVLVTLVPTVAVGACTYFENPEPYRPSATYAKPDKDALALGRQLYQRDCAFCHGDEAGGTSRGPDLVSGTNGPALTDFMLRTGRMPIDDPDETPRPRSSPYDEDEIAALVGFIDQEFEQPGPDIPRVDPADGDLVLGQSLYEQNCAACHASTGIGGVMLTEREEGGVSGVIIPELADSSPVDVAEAARTGPGPMPRFGPGVLDDQQLDALVRYTEYLRDPDDRGGAAIGHIGPVAEGAAGWVLGLGILVVFIRWVGTKRGERA
jgi:quinol---cytochrome-c reductase cytochrome c subunit